MTENGINESEEMLDDSITESPTEETVTEEESNDEAVIKPVGTESGLSHLTSSVPRSAKAPAGVLTKQQMSELREIFAGMDDTEIQRLYKRVTKSN